MIAEEMEPAMFWPLVNSKHLLTGRRETVIIHSTSSYWVLPMGNAMVDPGNTPGNSADKVQSSWRLLFGRGEAPIFQPPAVKSQLNGKDSDTGKDWRQKENGRAAEDEMHHQWTWIWANSGSQWRTEKPVALQSMGLQRAGRDRATEQWTILVHEEDP